MASLYLLIPLSVLIVFFAGVVLWWASRGGQFEDLEGPAWHIVQDDDTPVPEPAAEAASGSPEIHRIIRP